VTDEPDLLPWQRTPYYLRYWAEIERRIAANKAKQKPPLPGNLGTANVDAARLIAERFERERAPT